MKTNYINLLQRDIKVYPIGTVVRDMYSLNEYEFDKPQYQKIENGKWKLGTAKYFTIDDSSIGENKRFKLVSIPNQEQQSTLPISIEDAAKEYALSEWGLKIIPIEETVMRDRFENSKDDFIAGAKHQEYINSILNNNE